MPNGNYPVETKVKAATLGAGAGVILSQFLGWLVDLYVLTPGKEDGTPSVVSGFITLLVTAGLTFAAGYQAKHTPRPVVPVDGTMTERM